MSRFRSQTLCPEFRLTTQRLLGWGAVGGLAPPSPSDPDFVVAKNEISQKEMLIWLFWVHKFLDFWVPGPPPPLRENSACAGPPTDHNHNHGLHHRYIAPPSGAFDRIQTPKTAVMLCTVDPRWALHTPPSTLPLPFAPKRRTRANMQPSQRNWGTGRDAVEGGGVTPPPSLTRAPSLRPAPVSLTPSAGLAFVTDSNRPQPLWQPPPTACPTASVGASEALPLLMHP